MRRKQPLNRSPSFSASESDDGSLSDDERDTECHSSLSDASGSEGGIEYLANASSEANRCSASSPVPFRRGAEEFARYSPRCVDVWAVPEGDVVEVDYVVGGRSTPVL